MFVIRDEVSSESWEFETFAAAKAKIHDLLAGPYHLQEFIDEQVVPQFDRYCAEHYPDGESPDAFSGIISMLRRFVETADYAATFAPFEDFQNEDFDIYTDCDGEKMAAYFYSELEGFPQGEINMLTMDDEDAEYFFFVVSGYLQINLTLHKE